MQTEPVLSQAATKNVETCRITPHIANFLSTYHWAVIIVLGIYLLITLYLALRKKIGWVWFIFPALSVALFLLSLYLLP